MHNTLHNLVYIAVRSRSAKYVQTSTRSFILDQQKALGTFVIYSKLATLALWKAYTHIFYLEGVPLLDIMLCASSTKAFKES